MESDESKYLHALRALDDIPGWYAPSGFDYEAASERFLGFAQEFRQACGVDCRIDWSQDASFPAEFELPQECCNRPTGLTDQVVLRVSNWGNLATVTDDAAIEPEWMDRIKALLDQFGYMYIPPSILQGAYLPICQHDLAPGARLTWWDRYFEYL